MRPRGGSVDREKSRGSVVVPKQFVKPPSCVHLNTSLAGHAARNSGPTDARHLSYKSVPATQVPLVFPCPCPGHVTRRVH
jgi:hypothetical protein